MTRSASEKSIPFVTRAQYFALCVGLGTFSLDGALVFELRQSQSTGEYIVRTSYVAQTMDQLRNQTALTLAAPPASVPVFVPGCSAGNATYDCSLEKFVRSANQLIDPHSSDLVN